MDNTHKSYRSIKDTSHKYCVSIVSWKLDINIVNHEYQI